MDRARLNKAESIFHDLAGLAKNSRAAHLELRCAGDGELRSLVEHLLASDDSGMGDFLRMPAFFPGDDSPPKDASTGPQWIGGYEIVRCIGEGGMGVVYEARQANPRRRVALKVLRSALPSSEMLSRFRHEAHILAQLRHPGIAHIYEASVAQVALADGIQAAQPYFAMEMVEGQPLRAYAENNGLDTRQRLALMTLVCAGVQHAHEKGVIHRDLKSENILVEASGQPRILDFGVARLVGSADEPRTLHTRAGEIVGTLAYMSPEQVGGDSTQVDTRSDVYSLGVILYDLLTGRLPHNVSGLTLSEAARRISDDEPPPPSAHNSRLRGEVDWMVMKCLEKDRSRRYPSAGELARDLGHYLAGEAIEARRDSGWYVMRKALGRHRGAVTVGVLLILGVAAAAVYQSVQSRRYSRLAERERDARVATQEALHRAETAEHSAQGERDEARRARDAAQGDRETSEAINRFLQGMLAAASPLEQGRDVRLDEVLDAAAKKLDVEDSALPPHAEAAVRTTLGSTWQSLGKLEQAEAQFRRALETRTGLYGTEHADVAASLNHLGEVRFLRGDVAEAERVFVEVLALRRRLLGPAHPDLGESLNNVAFVLAAQDRFDEAGARYREALAVWRNALGDNHPNVALALDNMAQLHLFRGDYAQAEPLCREGYERRLAAFSRPDHPAVATSRHSWAIALMWLGNLDTAEHLFRTNLEINERQVGELHSNTVSTLQMLGYLVYQQSRPEEAEALLRDALDREVRAKREGSDNWATAMGNLGLVLRDRQDAAGAEQAFWAALDAWRRQLGEGRPSAARMLNNLAEVRLYLGDVEGADHLVCEALSIDLDVYGEAGSAAMAAHLHHRGTILNERGNYEESEALFREAFAMRMRVLGPQHALTISTQDALARVPTESPREGENEGW